MPTVPPPPSSHDGNAFAEYNEQLRRLIPLTDDQLLMMARRHLVPAGGEFQIPPGMVMLTEAGLLEVLRDVAGRGWSDESSALRDALTKIRTAGYNWNATAQWMQKVAASALEPGKWPDAGEQPLATLTAPPDEDLLSIADAFEEDASAPHWVFTQLRLVKMLRRTLELYRDRAVLSPDTGTKARRFGESITDDQLAAIVDTGGANVFEGDVARIAAELLARRAGSPSHG